MSKFPVKELAWARRPGTFDPVPINSAAATRIASTPVPVLEIAERLLVRDDATGTPVDTSASPVDAGALGDAIVEIARVNAQQLRLLIDLVDVVACAQTVVLDVYDLAREFGVCSGGAVGAAATLLELTVLADERQMAEHLASAMATFADDELLCGAAALTAALSATIADWLELDAHEVHLEIVAALGHRRPSGDRCRRGVGRRLRGRSAVRRCDLTGPR